MKKLVQEGKVKHLGLSEASASDIRHAHAVQMEWSLWTRDLEEDIIPTCRELGIAIVPHSPLGRGFFAGYTVEGNKEGDMRANLPRMTGENFEKNKVLQEQLKAIAEKKKCSLNQLALAWVLHKVNDVVPIPGTTKKANLESNIGAVAVALSKEEIAEIEAALPIDGIAGGVTLPVNMQLSRHYALSPPLSSWKEGI